MKKRLPGMMLAAVVTFSLCGTGFALPVLATGVTGTEETAGETEEAAAAETVPEIAGTESAAQVEETPSNEATEETQEEPVETASDEAAADDAALDETEEVATEDADAEEEQPEERTAAYEGITLDGDFSDWDAVAKISIGDGSVDTVAMVFDGEYVYIYISEPKDSYWQVATGAGVTGDGKFVITTDTGKQSVFYLRQDRITDRNGQTISGTSLVYKDKQYEICLPASFVQAYNNTITLGYYEGRDLVSDVANLQGHSSSQTDENNGSAVEYGDGFADWAGYPHTTIAYSTIDAEGSAALYTQNGKAYIHEITSNAVDKSEYAGNLTPFTICLNGDEKVHENLVYLKLISADASGNTTDNGEADLSALTPGTHEFYVADNTVAWGFSNWNVNNSYDLNHTIYGKATVLVTETGYEMECTVDLEKLAAVYSSKKNVAFTANDIKQIEVQFGDIGQQWVTWAGTSTGPWIGAILAALLAILAAWRFCRKESFPVMSETA